MQEKFDYIIVGAGLTGALHAYFLTKQGYRCLVIDKRNHIAGNMYTQKIEGIHVHKYGAHIFHTSNKKVWDFVNSIIEFTPFINSPIANYNGELYNLPFNMNTFHQLWNEVVTPEDAKNKIESEKIVYETPLNLEQQAISLVGTTIYEKLIKGYTEKQWGRKCVELPASIIKRLPVRYTYDNNYFNDIYQGIPKLGYTLFINKLLEGSTLALNEDFFNIEDWHELASKCIYTGPIDKYFNYSEGKLDWRTVIFETEIKDIDNYQGNAVVNYTGNNELFTRIIEHKHFDRFNTSTKTIISKEYSCEYKEGMEQYYPVNDEKNNTIYNKYKELADKEKNVIFTGRLAEYKYYDMDDIIEKILNIYNYEI